MPNYPIIQAALDQAVGDGVFPGAVLAVRHGGASIDVYAAGRLSSAATARSVQAATIYDLDKETITDVNFEKKEVSVTTFAEMKAFVAKAAKPASSSSRWRNRA